MWHNRQNWLNSPALSDLPLDKRFAVITWLVYWTRGLLAGPCHRPNEGRRHTGISAPENTVWQFKKLFGANASWPGD